MSGQQPPGQAASSSRPPHTPAQSSRSQSSANPPVPSIETPDPTIQQQSSTAHTPRSSTKFRVPESPSSTGHESSSKAAKVAIPRLKRPSDAASEDARAGGRHRVTHACEPCRHRKTKCSGERPVCRHCADFKITCFYADGKRDRVKKQFGTMTEKVADYERLLKGLLPRVNDADARLIRASLEKEALTDGEDPDGMMDEENLGTGDRTDADSVAGAESEASGGVGSTGALDRTDEDFTREQARATGFLGKNSEITWLQRVREENKYGDREGDAQGDDLQQRPGSVSGASISSSKRVVGDQQNQLSEAEMGFAINDSSYHLDDLSVTTFEAVDPYEMPTSDTARNLFNSYITRVHPTFPIVGKLNLSAQFQRFVNGTIKRPPEKWLAIINLIFAIGAKYAHLINADWKGDERDHLIYFSRARLLSMTSETMFQHPDLQQIQIVGLMSFYLLCNSQINRAWILNGIAIRQASSLGMNMRNDSTNLKDSLKEIRYRVWWALYTLEHRLCSMTGRVNCILDEHCTTPLPVPFEEDEFESAESQSLLTKEKQQGDRAPASNPQTPNMPSATPSSDRSRSQTKIDSRSPSAGNRLPGLEWAKDVPPNSSLYFLYMVQMARITQNIFHRLYNPTSVRGTWSSIQAKIKELDEQLELWYRALPQAFAFRRKQRERNSYEARLALGFFFYGTKMTIHRPCLCRLDRKVPNQSTQSHEFNRNSAGQCVEAAVELFRLIPDEPNAVGLIRVGPWWSILHFLVQATTILMLEISFRVNHMPEEAEVIIQSGKKGIRWLHALGEDNISAKRAWALCFPMFRDSAQKIGRDVTDLPSNPPGKLTPPQQHTSISDFGFGQAMYPPQTMPHSTYMTMPNAQAFSMYDPMMHYDQYFPSDFSLGQNMPFQPAPDSDMEFITTAYDDNQSTQHPGPSGGESSRHDFN